MTADPTLALRRRQYRDPPVVEAVCRLHWDKPCDWNVTTPGLLFEAIRDVYPEEPRTQSVMQADIQQSGLDASFAVRGAGHRMMFSADSGSRLLIVGPQDIAAHGLPPYEGWEMLEARLFNGADALNRILAPQRVLQVGLRYVNRVEIESASITFADYFTMSLEYPPGFPPNVTAFLERAEFPYPDDMSFLAFTWASAEAPEGNSAFVLDLDLHYQPPEPIAMQEAREALARLKDRETTAFESLLTDRLRAQFGEAVDA